MTQPSTRRRPQGPTGSTRRSAGFTLIELMIAVAIVAILASIAYPSYTRYVQEARRTDAMSKLTDVAGRMERCYTVKSSYTQCLTDLGLSGGGTINSDEGFYQVTGSLVASGAGYTLTASPDSAPKDAQVGDSCGDFTLNHQGDKGSDGTDCW